MEKSKSRFLTEFLECLSISTSTEITSNPVFYKPKEGFLRVVKDDTKRSYFLELFANSKLEEITKPAVRLEVNLKKNNY